MEFFGCSVNWDNVNKVAIAEKGSTKVQVPIGKNYIYKNGEKISTDTAAIIKDGRTYLPIRAVLESFDASVSWDALSSKVVVKSKEITSTVLKGKTTLTIHIIDVGQGDSIFLDNGEYEVLIDAGTASMGTRVSSYINPYVEGKLDLVIGTHAHSDHIGGLTKIITQKELGLVQ